MQLTKLQETLLVFAGLKNQLEPALKAVKRYLRDEDLKFTVTNHLLILVSSFLEEWQRFEGMGSDSEVQRTLQSAKPAIKRIRQWKGITKLRSSALAHGFRQKDGSLTRLESLFQGNRAPCSYGESILLGECAVYAIATAICQHSIIYKEGLSEWNAAGQTQILENGIQTLQEFEAEINRVRSEISATDPCLEPCFRGIP